MLSSDLWNRTTTPAAPARGVVVKISASEPLVGVDAHTFTLRDEAGKAVPARVAQISDLTWALFPNQIFLEPGKTYSASLADPICDRAGNCADPQTDWHFTIATDALYAAGDTRPPEPPGLLIAITVSLLTTRPRPQAAE